MADHGVPISPQQVLSAAAHPQLNGEVTPATAPKLAKTPPKPQAPPAHEHKDGPREIVETVVFVVVLVLLLKSFVAEAFVIPTGSMAETLWGYQKVVDCPKCQFRFPVNCSREVDPQDGPKEDTVHATCPNCRHHINFAAEGIDPSWSSGDRVLVAKFLYDLLNRLPERHDVVVFKYPERPQKGTIPTNYIKRLVGLPGETIAIHGGNLYYMRGFDYPENEHRRRPARAADLWNSEYMYGNDEEALRFFREGKFQITRKSPKLMLAERCIVYDNEFQNPDRPLRWEAPAGGAWTPDNPARPRVFVGAPASDAGLAWLRYQHILERGAKPSLITDFMGYNTYRHHRSENWVGDLMLECEVTPDQAAGELILELSRGVDRFRARFDLAAGVCTLERVGADALQKIASKEVVLKPGTKHQLRFANFDERLTLWVNGSLPFEDGVTYLPAAEQGATTNDLEPASVGIKGGKVTVAQLRLWRDTYYTVHHDSADTHNVEWDNPSTWGTLQQLPVKTMYVQPDHFLCMGDNSPESSDGRTWGLVPRRLLLGRALAVYYPFYFPYWPLNSRANRIGAIK